VRYEERAPHEALAPFVECLWHASDSRPAAGPRPPERLLPDGCVEWIFHLADPYLRLADDGSVAAQPASFVVGPMTRPIVVAASGVVATVGVRFRPGGARPFLPVALGELTDASAKCGDLWSAGAGRRIEEAVLGAPDGAARRGAIEAFLLDRLARHRADSHRTRLAARAILRTRGRATVATIARQSGWSRRQLERRFREDVGFAPKTLARIVRFQNALRLSGRDPGRTWADVAASCGYADQAHLNRDFREFAGTTPAARAASEGDLGRHFVEPGRIDALLSARDPDVAFLQDGEGPRP
jgi:AraC-like DNA-binding protein